MELWFDRLVKAFLSKKALQMANWDRIETNVAIHGPATVNPHLFDEALKADERSWRIIDGGDFSALVPVCNIMAKHNSPEIRNTALVVCDTWLEKARDMLHLPLVQMEYERVCFSRMLSNIGKQLRQFEKRSLKPLGQTLLRKEKQLFTMKFKFTLN